MKLDSPIITERLIISEHEESDLTEMHKLLSDETSMYYLKDIQTKTLEDTKRNLITAIEESKQTNRSKYFFKICNKKHEYIGEIGFTVRFECKEGKNVDLGYFIKKEYWNNGYTTEAAKACIEFGFKNLSILKIETGCIVNNTASELIMKKLGMKQESYKKMHVLHDGEAKDRVEYALFKEDYYRNK